MGKTLLHRLFGFGRIPKRYAATLRSEGIVLIDEGIGGTITLRNFRAPGRWHSWKRSWFTGCVVLTEKTFAAFGLFRPLVYLPLCDERLKQLDCSIKESSILSVSYDASLFNESWSGSVECRFKTPMAALFIDRLAVND